jgi:hypothetical protein
MEITNSIRVLIWELPLEIENSIEDLGKKYPFPGIY